MFLPGAARSLLLLSLSGLSIATIPAYADGKAVIPDDTNSRITVENAVVKGNKTTVFFYTWPYLGDPGSGKPCPLNYYSVALRPGIPEAKAEVVAKGVCGGLLQKSRLLDTGDALLLVGKNLERWQDGEKVASRAFSSIPTFNEPGMGADMADGLLFAISPRGDVITAVYTGMTGYGENKAAGSTLVVAALKPDGNERWRAKIDSDAMGLDVKQIVAGADGGALLSIESLASGLSPTAESQLHFIAPDGSRKLLSLNEVEAAMDFSEMQNMSPGDIQRYLQQQDASRAEAITRLRVTANPAGGYEVLFHRTGGTEERQGYFLHRIDARGELYADLSLGNAIALHGLDRWTDFRISGNSLLLLSSVLATQQGVTSKRKKWMQNAVSWIDLDTGIPDTRLIPLDRRYLEAAMNAGDADMKYLDGLPGGEPALLTTLGQKPLVVAVGMISKRPALRLNEADGQLLAYTEAFDERRAKIAKEEARQQRKSDRAARTRQMNDDMAAALGMTVEDYAALSSDEQMQLMVRQGDMGAMMSVMMKQTESLQQEMAGSGNLTPQETAQIEAAVQKAQQMFGGAGEGAAAMPGPVTKVSEVSEAQTHTTPDAEGSILTVDPLGRGHVRFTDPDSKSVTLIVYDRSSGEELSRREYLAGVIDEYINLGRFKTPLADLGVAVRNSSGEILVDLTPEATGE